MCPIKSIPTDKYKSFCICQLVSKAVFVCFYGCYLVIFQQTWYVFRIYAATWNMLFPVVTPVLPKHRNVYGCAGFKKTLMHFLSALPSFSIHPSNSTAKEIINRCGQRLQRWVLVSYLHEYQDYI